MDSIKHTVCPNTKALIKRLIFVLSRLQQGITLINNLTNKKFQALLSRIINTANDQVFTDSETQKLQETLKLNEQQLQLLLQSIAHIHKQSTKVILKPTDLQRQLVEVLGFEQEKAEIFTKEWSSVLKEELGDLEIRRKLTNLSWELNVQTASDLGSKLAIPSASIQLDLAKVI